MTPRSIHVVLKTDLENHPSIIQGKTNGRRIMSFAALEETNERQATSGRIGEWITAERVESVGIMHHAIRYGLVVVLLWIGAMKFTTYEAEGISGLVANSPLMSWAYQTFSTRQFSALLGITELLIATLIAVRPFSPRVSALGSALAAGMFLTTLSFLASTPGVAEPSLGFPALSVLPGQFLIKDIVLLGAAVWATGEAMREARRRSTLENAALSGHDPVAYFTGNEPKQGAVEFRSEYKGKQYYFASVQHKELFDREPERYLPQYDGYCAFGVAMGQLFDVDPKTGQVIDGKLYVNLNRKILADFNKNVKSYIEQADKKWPDVCKTAA